MNKTSVVFYTNLQQVILEKLSKNVDNQYDLRSSNEVPPFSILISEVIKCLTEICLQVIFSSMNSLF